MLVIYGISAVLTLSGHPRRGYSLPVSGTVSQSLFQDQSPLVWVAQKKWIYIFMLYRHFNLILFSGIQTVLQEACKLSLFSLPRKKNPPRHAPRYNLNQASRSYQAMYSHVYLQNGFAAMQERTAPS